MITCDVETASARFESLMAAIQSGEESEVVILVDGQPALALYP